MSVTVKTNGKFLTKIVYQLSQLGISVRTILDILQELIIK